MAKGNSQSWEKVSERMPELLKELECSYLLQRDSRGRLCDERGKLANVPDQGIYVFYKELRPLYVGRSGSKDNLTKKSRKAQGMRGRILQHSQRGSGQNQAALAFLMAEKWARKQGIKRGLRTRKEFANDEKFKLIFIEAKADVWKMGVRVVEINDDHEQYAFELYAALELGTTLEQEGFNSFKTSL